MLRDNKQTATVHILKTKTNCCLESLIALGLFIAGLRGPAGR